MRKFLVPLVFFLVALVALGAAADEDLKLDLSLYSQEQLLNLRNAIDAKIVSAPKGETIYDKDGLFVSWAGIQKRENRFDKGYTYQLDVLVANESEEDLEIGFSEIAINGFLILTSNNFYTELPAGFNLFTGASNICIFDDSTLSDSRIENINTVHFVLSVRRVENRKVVAEIPFSSGFIGFE